MRLASSASSAPALSMPPQHHPHPTFCNPQDCQGVGTTPNVERRDYYPSEFSPAPVQLVHRDRNRLYLTRHKLRPAEWARLAAPIRSIGPRRRLYQCRLNIILMRLAAIRRIAKVSVRHPTTSPKQKSSTTSSPQGRHPRRLRQPRLSEAQRLHQPRWNPLHRPTARPQTIRRLLPPSKPDQPKRNL